MELNLKREQVAMVIEALAEFPYKRVQQTIVDIINQVNAQDAQNTKQDAGSAENSHG